MLVGFLGGIGLGVKDGEGLFYILCGKCDFGGVIFKGGYEN
jgi:hypothetical protein